MCPGEADHRASVTVLSAQSVTAEAFTLRGDSGPRLTAPDTAVLICQELPAGSQEPTQGKHAEAAGLQLYLHVDQQLPQVARRHHDGGVELDDVALVQCDVMVRCQTLHAKHRNDTSEPSAMNPDWENG